MNKPYREAILPEGSRAALFHSPDPKLSGDRLVLEHSDGTFWADCFICLIEGRYRLFFNRLTMLEREPLSGAMDLEEAFPAVFGFYFGIYRQYLSGLTEEQSLS